MKCENLCIIRTLCTTFKMFNPLELCFLTVWALFLPFWSIGDNNRTCTVYLRIEHGATITIAVMSRDIPKFNKEFPIRVTFNATWRATARWSICKMLHKYYNKTLKTYNLYGCTEIYLRRNICGKPSHPPCTQLFEQDEQLMNLWQ